MFERNGIERKHAQRRVALGEAVRHVAHANSPAPCGIFGARAAH